MVHRSMDGSCTVHAVIGERARRTKDWKQIYKEGISTARPSGLLSGSDAINSTLVCLGEAHLVSRYVLTFVGGISVSSSFRSPLKRHEVGGVTLDGVLTRMNGAMTKVGHRLCHVYAKSAWLGR